ncbi:HNH endonuclease [bacterium]|nr:HNH endonuclease [bacterium]
MKKLTYAYIKQFFEEEGYTLLPQEYINAKQKLNFVCNNGHTHAISWDHFGRGVRCRFCSSPNVTYLDVKQFFELNGYTLLSKEYINNNTKLKCVCPNGHTSDIDWAHFKKGVRCTSCTRRTTKTIAEIQIAFAREGYTCVSTEYKNTRSKLNYICLNGHVKSTCWKNFSRGDRCPNCARSGEGGNSWKGGVRKLNLPLYETYAPQLEKYQPVYKIEQDNLKLLGVHCMYCDKVFVPTLTGVRSKLEVICGSAGGENNFYCSESCKKACPTYRQRSYPKGFKVATSREVQPELRKLVLARDDYACKICGNGLDYAELHCHHITGIEQNPIESADVDNCITLCKKCHKKVHELPDCRYHDLKCKK